MKISIARVYHGGGRRWFTLAGACKAEAKARVKERCRVHPDYFLYDSDSYVAKLIDRYARLLEREHRRTTP